MTLLPVLLPEGYVPKVSVNDKLTAGALIAEKKGKGAEEVVHVSQILGIPPQKMPKHVKKSLGASVSKGEAIAVKKGFLGFGAKKIISEFSGTVVKIDNEAGNLLIHVSGGESQTETIVSPVDGTVDFCNNEKVVIKTEKETVIAQKAQGEETRGEFTVLEGKDIGFDAITSEVSKKIVLGRNFEHGSIFKALGLGALGIVGVEIRDGDLEELKERRIGTPIMEVEEENFKKLLKHRSSQLYLDPKNNAVVIL